MKNFIKLFQNILFITLLAGFSVGAPAMKAPQGAPAGQQELSPEDLKLLEEIGKEVDNYVNRLPTREQLRAQGLPEAEILKAETKEKFQEEVERYSKMSEEQLLAEMEKALAEAASAAEQPQPIQQPQEVQPRYEEPLKPAEPVIEKPVVSNDKQQVALQLINNLISSMSNFLAKAQMMVELPGKVQSWIKEGKLRGWPANLTWSTIKSQIETLEAQLRKITDKDPRTNKYKYLDDLIANEGLYNNLAKVKDSLARNEPKIILSPFGLEKMTSESRQATRSVLLSLHEAISILGIPSALDAIIAKYEPTAKKIKETEEASQRKALEESRRTRLPGSTVAGAPTYEPMPQHYGEREYDFGRGYQPSYESGRSGIERAPESKKTEGGKGGAGGGAGAEAGKGGEPKKEEGKKEEAKKLEEDKSANAFATDFSKELYKFEDTLDTFPNLANIEMHIKDANFVDDELVDKGIPEAINEIRTAARDAKGLKRQLGKKKLTEEQKKELRKEVKDSYKDVKSKIDSLTNQISNLEKPGQALLSVPASNLLFANAKLYAYFGKKNENTLMQPIETKKRARQPLSAEETQVDTMVTQYKNKSVQSLESLKKAMQDLKKAVDDLQ